LGVAVIILSVLGVSWQQSLLLKKANNSNT